MAITLDNVGIAVDDLDAAVAFFTDLGLNVVGRDEVSGEWADTAVGLDGNHAKIALLEVPDGSGRIELFEYLHPHAIATEPTLPHENGMHRVAFRVDDLDEALAVAARLPPVAWRRELPGRLRAHLRAWAERHPRHVGRGPDEALNFRGPIPVHALASRVASEP